MSEIFVDFQLFPHCDTPLHRQQDIRPFLFSPIENRAAVGKVIHIGRKIDRNKDVQRGTTREDRAAHNVSMDPAHMTSNKSESITDCIAFRSKVVSRNHAELWVGDDGKLYFRDVGSSSGSFLNRLRLSPTGKESRPHQLNSGDIIQLGVDYQGRQEEIYKAVVIKVFINSKKQIPELANRVKYFSLIRMNKALRALICALNPKSQKEDENQPTDCCICINAMAPFQALFLAPCSHCFHYKCVTTLLGAGFMFQCPICRQVANLEASVAEPEDFDKSEVEKENLEDSMEVDSTGDIALEVSEANRFVTLARPDFASNASESGSPPLDIPDHVAARNTIYGVTGTSPSTPMNESNIPSRLSDNNSLSNNDQEIREINRNGDSLLNIFAAASSGDQQALEIELERYSEKIKEVLDSTIEGDEQLRNEILQKLLNAVNLPNQ